MGTILTPGLKRFNLPPVPVVPRVPLGNTLREVPSLFPVTGTRLDPVMSCSSSDSSSLIGPRIAAVGPGKSSGTMGLPLTLESLEGGVEGSGAAGRDVVVVPRVRTGPVTKLVWNGSV